MSSSIFFSKNQTHTLIALPDAASLEGQVVADVDLRRVVEDMDLGHPDKVVQGLAHDRVQHVQVERGVGDHDPALQPTREAKISLAVKH